MLSPFDDHPVHQQVMRAKWGERTGLGVLEQLVIGSYEPGGFRELLDGAPG